MPVKRRGSKARQHRVTPEAVEAFERGDWMGLHRALGLRPWQMSPLDVDPAEEPPNDHGGNPYDKSWSLACELRAELEKAAGEIGT